MPSAPEPVTRRRRAARSGRGFLLLLVTALILTIAIAALPLLGHA